MYSNVKTSLDEISARIQQNRKRLGGAKTAISQAIGDISAMETQYGAIVTEINNLAAANPNNPAYQHAKAETDLLVAEFNALKATAQDMGTAVEPHEV